jgi:hypothetical protein
VLAVVQDQQQWRAFRCADSVSTERRAGALRDPEHLRHRRRHQQRLADRAKLDEPHPVAVRVDHFGRRLQREPRLADAAHADDRQQSACPATAA